MQVISALTGELADCTIGQGVNGIGAIADIDLFAAFTLEPPELGGDSLWEVKPRIGGVYNPRAEKTLPPQKWYAEYVRGLLERGELDE